MPEEEVVFFNKEMTLFGQLFFFLSICSETNNCSYMKHSDKEIRELGDERSGGIYSRREREKKKMR